MSINAAFAAIAVPLPTSTHVKSRAARDVRWPAAKARTAAGDPRKVIAHRSRGRCHVAMAAVLSRRGLPSEIRRYRHTRGLENSRSNVIRRGAMEFSSGRHVGPGHDQEPMGTYAPQFAHPACR